MRRILPFEELDVKPFLGLPDEIRSPEMFTASEWVNHLVDAASLQVLEELGPGLRSVREVAGLTDENERTARVSELAREAGVAPDRREVFAWLYRWILDPGRVVGVAIEDFRDPLAGFPAFETSFERAVEAEPEMRPNAELIRFALAGYSSFLRGEIEGDRVLFQPGSLSLWEEYFSNDHRITRSLNQMGARVAGEELEGRDELEIIELGGGLGSAARCLVETLGPRVKHYLFTDVVAGFIRRAMGDLEELFPGLQLDSDRVDINAPLGEQGLEPGSRDLVYAVNVLHLARDLRGALEQIRKLLRPGGRLIFVEGVRPTRGRPIAAEFAFHLLEAFRDVEVGLPWRPDHGFLTASDWQEALRVAGYSRSRVVPEVGPAVEAYPNHYLGVVVAEG